MKSTKKGKKAKRIITIFLIVLVAITMIFGGIYLDYINSPQKLFSAFFDDAITYLETANLTSKTTGINNNYTLKSNIKFNIESKTLQTATTPEEIEHKNIITNLNNTTSNFQITQDVNNKKMYINYISMLNEEELINSKYLIENSTEFYQVNGIVDNYVNNGNNTYFEALTEQTTHKDNLIHILKVVSKSMKKNLKEEYFLVKQDELVVQNKKTKVTKTSLELNDKTTRELINNVLKDLKQEELSNRILTGINKDFKNIKIDEETKIFDIDQKITINTYTDCLGKLYLIEYIYRDGENEYRLTYEKEPNEIYYIENNKVVYQIICDTTSKKKTFTFYDKRQQELGKIVYDKTSKRKTITTNLNINDKTYDIVYDNKIENINKSKSYDNKIDIIIKIYTKTDNHLSANIAIENNITTDLKIEEDTSQAIFASSITEEQQKQLSEKLDNIYTRLMN